MQTRKIIISGSLILLSLAWFLIINPIIKKSELRNKLEISIIESPMSKIFATIEKYDNENYHKIIEKLVSSATKSGANVNEVLAEATRLGATFANNYFQKADFNDVYNYIVNYTNFLLSLFESQPIVICQLENPQNFGSPDDELIKKMEQFNILIMYENIIKSAVLKSSKLDRVEAGEEYRDFIEKYRNNYPTHWKILSNKLVFKGQENIKNYALAYLDFYKELVKLKPKVSSNIYKYLKYKSI